MNDGQALSVFHPDRSEEDTEDLELVVESYPETEAHIATLGVGFNRPSESDYSIKRFMAEWSSDADAPADYSAESQSTAQTVAEGKHPELMMSLAPPRSPRRRNR